LPLLLLSLPLSPLPRLVGRGGGGWGLKTETVLDERSGGGGPEDGFSLGSGGGSWEEGA